MSSENSGAKLWGGRFTGKIDPLMMQYNESLSFDHVLYDQDIRGSIAYARAIAKAGILTKDEFEKIEAGLMKVREEWASNSFLKNPEVDEDIHTANERRLGELIGTNVAGKLHTGRSRNDQVATDMRMWLRDELRKVDRYLIELIGVMVHRAEQEIDYLMPGCTHLQFAQPIRWSHWMLLHAWKFSDELTRLRQVVKRINRCPLGSGALAGNPFHVSREDLAEELGFEGVIKNSLAAVGDRDFVHEMLQWASSLMIKISRLAEDLIIYSSQPFGFVKLADAYSTGSSLMPQKKNPDSLELLRGKTGTVLGKDFGLATTIKGLPTTYNKDLQESWESMLSAKKTISDSVQITNGVIGTLTVYPEKMHAALLPEMLATEIADYLVRKGVPFREGHHISGRVVALAEQKGIPMDQLTAEQVKGVDSRLEDDVKSCFDYERAVELKAVTGGTSRSAVMAQIHDLKGLLKSAVTNPFNNPVED